jgi:2,4-dienoyl-CoA reductase-like NADH-dependent reductase (Old Yellow Enzyme family)
LAHALGASELRLLFEPIRIGGLVSRNRIVSLPHGNSYGSDGVPFAGSVPYMRHVASSTAGIVTIGASAVHPTTYRAPLFALYNERAVPRLREMVSAIHDGGALAISQLGHSGRHAPLAQPGLARWGPSPLPPLPDGELLEPMGEKELEELRAAYQRSAQQTLEIGSDGVEVHAAHGYLMQQFLSPYFNRRTDAYGGPVENRMRLLLEILGALRALARDRLVGIRLGAGDDRPGGLEWEDVLEVARRLAAAKLVDYISLSVAARPGRYVRDESFPRGGLRERTAALRAGTGLPVTISQRVDTPDLAEEILRQGEADLIGLARELIADPEWGTQARSGNASRIRPCVLCMKDCRRAPELGGNGAVSCMVNPTAFDMPPVAAGDAAHVSAARVVVVGGGPAGCEAALGAARRGAAVVLFERDSLLGGAARRAGRAPYRQKWRDYADYLEAEVRATPLIEVRTGTVADEAMVALARPQLVVVATGATMTTALTATVPVVSSYALFELASVPTWRSAIVVDHYGRWDGANAAELLAVAGTQVTYVSRLARIADQVSEESRDFLIPRLLRAGVVPILGADAEAVPLDRVDAVVVAGELGSEGASRAWDLGGVPVWRIGDCLAPRGMSFATREGWLAGMRVAPVESR